MSNCITLFTELEDAGVIDVNLPLPTPMRLPPRRPGQSQILLQCMTVDTTVLIPNIFNGIPFGLGYRTDIIGVGNNIDGWKYIQFDMGIYEAEQLNAAINAAINAEGWWLDPDDPGFTLFGNPVIQKHVIRIDSTKLDPTHGTQFMVDVSLAGTGSTLYYALGYNITDVFMTDGEFPTLNTAHMDVQGTNIVIESNIASPRRYKGDNRNILADISFAGIRSYSNIIWPQGGQISPEMLYSGPESFSNVSLIARGSKGQKLVFMSGSMTVTVRFIF